MKKIHSLILILLSIVLFSCSSDNPRSVAESYTKELAKGNFEKAKEYCTPESGAVLEMLNALDMEDPNLIDPKFKFKFVRETVNDNDAEVFYENRNGEEKSVKLVKWEGKWKAVMMF